MKKQSLKERVTDEHIENLIFVDPIPKKEVYSFIAQADVGISALQKNDTFKTIYSNKTFDYMACKTPVVMVIDGISRQLIETANCGIYAEPENERAIADALLKYKLSPELINEHGENGYDYAKTYFDREKLAKEYVEQISEKLGLV